MYAMSGSEADLGSSLTAVFNVSVKFTQSTFRKLHLLTSLVCIDLMVVD